MGISRILIVAACGSIVFSCVGVARAGQPTPCGTAQGNAPFPGTSGLWLIPGGSDFTEFRVYDSNLGVCWLADANLAGDSEVRALISPFMTPLNADGSTPIINPDGTMDYETALNWVNALNLYNNGQGGQGWEGHTAWQLPAALQADTTCKSETVSTGVWFGVPCMNSALSNLYHVGLKEVFPNSVAPILFTLPYPFLNLQPGLYWASDSGPEGQWTFSFNNGQSGQNTTRYNYFHVLPMVKGKLGGGLSNGTGFQVYTDPPAVGKAVYDTKTDTTWSFYGNLPEQIKFDGNGPTTIVSLVDGSALVEPLINNDGAIYFSAIDPSQPTGYIVSMNARNYAGSSAWTLPSLDDLTNLYGDMGLAVGDVRLESLLFAGPFLFLQPGFYWSCERDPDTNLNAPCDPYIGPGTAPGNAQTPTQYSFNFDDGFLGTDQNTKMFYVTAYYPALPSDQR